MAVSIEKDDSPNCVQQCRVLYGVFRKKNPWKGISKNVWNAIAEEVGTENGTSEEKEFIKLRVDQSRCNMLNLMKKQVHLLLIFKKEK